MSGRRTDPVKRLADLIAVEKKKVVFITGAGLSAASGIPLFRGGDDGIWVQRATSLGTKSAFLRDTLKWYNTFWFPFFRHEFTRMQPNAGHEAIARLANLSPHVTVVTQNIDSLHQQTLHPWSTSEQLIEVHGRLGLYHCTSEFGCDLATESFARATEIFPPHIHQAIEMGSGRGVELLHVPSCPKCSDGVMMPLALMFDEDYTSHAFYQFDRAMDAFETADVLVFVGTSFSVNITSLALAQAKQRCIPVFNFNLKDPLGGSARRYDVYNIIGPSEEKLMHLADLAESMVRQMMATIKDTGSAEQGAGNAATTTISCASFKDEKGVALTAGEGKRASGEGVSAIDDTSSEGQPPSVLEENVVTLCPYEIDPAQPSQPLLRDQVIIEMSPLYARQCHPDKAVERAIDQHWMDLKAKSPSVVNKSKFRLAQCELVHQETFASTDDHTEDGMITDTQSLNGSNKRSKLCQERLVLRLWLTDYKTFRGTNWSPDVSRLMHDGIRDYGDVSAYLSQKLGVSAAVCTSDDKILLIRRSKAVAEGQGLLDVPGGHPEPADLGLDFPHPPSSSLSNKIESEITASSPTTSSIQASAAPLTPSQEAIVNEIFNSAAQEVADEINIPMTKLGGPIRLLGTVRQRNSAGCPSMAFLIPTVCTAAEVLAYYQEGPKEEEESTELLLLTIQEILNVPSHQLTPSAQGCLFLLFSSTAPPSFSSSSFMSLASNLG